MGAHALLDLSNELRRRDKMRGLPSILSLFRNEFDKVNNTRAQLLDSQLTSGVKSHYVCNVTKTPFHTCNVTRKSVNNLHECSCFIGLY